MKSKVMQIANRLVKQGVNRSAAMVRAWILVKLNRLTVKVVGVTFGIRQQLLHRPAKYQPEDVTIRLRRERGNAADGNAVQVIAAVRGKGKAVVGYLNREIAACIAALMDGGKTVYSRFRGVTGGEEYRLTYGLNLDIALSV
ncbi:MAG: HIRAN domain-containing protein [Bacteroides sp.]|nr:HIRAN domain-containing protein [Eubacterium sp.]MCM1419177.1 HIRAN domain-containing protein [Roseburia sp.]MCM1463074.1 HIRAN domain-containing protein [Bacteroides sp.]